MILGFLLVIGTVILMAAIHGFVASYLWYWFMVPLGLSPISVPHAIGLAILVGLFTYHKIGSLELNEEKIGQFVLTSVIVPLLMLLVGYIVHLLM
jgi:hypothetical protein